MSDVTKEKVLECLAKVHGPDQNSDLVSLGIVSDIFISAGKVMFSISVPADRAQELEQLRVAAEDAVTKLDGVKSAMVALTAERKAGEVQAKAPPQSPASAGPPPGQRGPKEAGTKEPSSAKPGVPGIKAIIAVASGKGGVGKSTTSINLALSLQALGLKIGVLDADIYGPSLPRLLGITKRPETTDGRTLKPLEGFGLKVMSMGFLVDEGTPMIWRGPMVISALTQMLREVDWGELDVLVVDMPPGTGDAQLTMSQQVPLAGAVIVSTPQDLALIDARKGLNMFHKVNVPILGIVENMSTFICPKCGERSDIFGHGGAREEADRVGVPFLGEVPLHLDIRKNSDAGTPVVVADPQGEHAKIFLEIAEKVQARLVAEAEMAGAASPNIVFE